MAGCSGQPEAPVTPTVTQTEDAHTRAVTLVKTVIPGATTAQVEDMMKTACQLIERDPTPSGILSARSSLMSAGFGNVVETTTLFSAAVAGECPEYLPALKGI